ncbi:MAG: NAD(P)-binding domain-containing protein [Proteobacteria bacterium]|nr:NAD(P)-binding domain-containing protein [Pseudomonadota bacterium]
MKRHDRFVFLILTAVMAASISVYADDDTGAATTVAIIGTGDMGDSLGPRFAELGYRVIYGSRNPDSEKSQNLVAMTGKNASITTQILAAQAGDIVVLAVGWPAMETVAQNLGSLDGKIVIDMSMPVEQAEDGYYVSIVATSSAEMIQLWNPGARVVKAFATQASYVIDDPDVVGGPVTVPIAADDRAAKEQVASIVAAMGLDPVDAGPLRLSREIEALQRLYMVPLLQRRGAAWEPYFRRSSFWECIWEDDWSDPVADAGKLADIPETQDPPKPCPGT